MNRAASEDWSGAARHDDADVAADGDKPEGYATDTGAAATGVSSWTLPRRGAVVTSRRAGGRRAPSGRRYSDSVGGGGTRRGNDTRRARVVTLHP